MAEKLAIDWFRPPLTFEGYEFLRTSVFEIVCLKS